MAGKRQRSKSVKDKRINKVARAMVQAATAPARVTRAVPTYRMQPLNLKDSTHEFYDNTSGLAYWYGMRDDNPGFTGNAILPYGTKSGWGAAWDIAVYPMMLGIDEGTAEGRREGSAIRIKEIDFRFELTMPDVAYGMGSSVVDGGLKTATVRLMLVNFENWAKRDFATSTDRHNALAEVLHWADTRTLTHAPRNLDYVDTINVLVDRHYVIKPTLVAAQDGQLGERYFQKRVYVNLDKTKKYTKTCFDRTNAGSGPTQVTSGMLCWIMFVDNSNQLVATTDQHGPKWVFRGRNRVRFVDA